MSIKLIFFRRIYNFTKNFFNNFRRVVLIDEETQKFIRYNKKIWSKWNYNHSTKSEVLVDLYGVAETLISYSYFVNILAKKYQAVIKSFGKNEILPNWYLHKIYKSFNVNKHIKTTLNKNQQIRSHRLYQKIIPQLKTKKNILNLKVLGIWAGIDIYESYLDRFRQPTINLADPKLWETVKEGISLVIFWQDYFKKHNIAGVVVSHDCYLHLDIIVKVAYKNHVPVYLPNIRGITYAIKPFSVYKYLPNLRKMFKKLTKKKQIEGISWAKRQLERRFKGEVGVDMDYAINSAFQQRKIFKPVLRNNDKIKVLICSHCFYDSPYGLGKMLFLDFYEWLHYLGKISNKTDYDWYLKVHPDPLPGTLGVVKGILLHYPKITLLPYATSHHQLAKEGINFVLTVHGSIGHEYPALGVQVINAGYNPHIAYNFNWHPKSLKEYQSLLLNLNKLKKTIDINDLYEFYYMHHNHVIADDLILKSYRKSLEDLTIRERIGPKIYSYFLNQLTEIKHQEIIKNMQRFIESRKHHYFSKGPED